MRLAGVARSRARGLTLLELAIALAVLAVLSALAVPSMASRLRAERLLTTAEMFAADVADARHESARRGQALHIEAQAAASTSSASGPAWCWAVATTTSCPCADAAAAAACRLKIVPAHEHPGVSLVQSQPVHLQPDGQASPVLAAVFSAGDRRMHVHVSRFGRARVCDPAGVSTRTPRC
ncbi:MAG: prepilin-type N-terminal cleavage/methylation domain-containing protein [Burkholderiales bacterium]|nr:prepilin-type N-terminal cleavage/methylation domain-containing protein [Burkholderiales bacterium]